MTCLICESKIEPFMDFGSMPIANGFLEPGQFDEEYFYNLRVAFCSECTMVQLAERVDREKMFHDHYAFFSSTSARMADHFERFAEEVLRHHLNVKDPFVVEFGSNDGILLRHFSDRGIRHWGIEPSENVAKEAVSKGVQTLNEFFDATLARKIMKERGQADVFMGANVMCHIPYLHSVIEGIKILLKPGGVLIFEDPYLGDIIEKVSFDQIYDEHAFYFSLSSISHLMRRHDLEVVDVHHQNVHGGSMRYTVAHRGARAVSPRVSALRHEEEKRGLHRPEIFDNFSISVRNTREKLISLLKDLQGQGKRVVGYGATSKSTTTINYCGLDESLVNFISDTTPSKLNKFSPGVHIPIKSHRAFSENYPDYALLFAWNHAEEIMEKERGFLKAGGKWIVYVPKVKVIERYGLRI